MSVNALPRLLPVLVLDAAVKHAAHARADRERGGPPAAAAAAAGRGRRRRLPRGHSRREGRRGRAPVLVDDGGGSASHVFFASASATAAVKASGFSPLNASTSAPPASLGPTIPLRSANLSCLVRDPKTPQRTGAASMTRERCTLQLSPSVPGALA